MGKRLFSSYAAIYGGEVEAEAGDTGIPVTVSSSGSDAPSCQLLQTGDHMAELAHD